MELRFIKYYFPDPFRTSSLMIGWFDVVYGHAMVLIYLVLIYAEYIHDEIDTYKVGLWLDFFFSLVHLVGGAILVYGVREKTSVLVLLCLATGFTVLISDLVGYILLLFSIENVSWIVYTLLALLILIYFGVRCLMIFAVYRYWKQLRQELSLRQRLENYIPETPQISTFS